MIEATRQFRPAPTPAVVKIRKNLRKMMSSEQQKCEFVRNSLAAPRHRYEAQPRQKCGISAVKSYRALHSRMLDGTAVDLRPSDLHNIRFHLRQVSVYRKEKRNRSLVRFHCPRELHRAMSVRPEGREWRLDEIQSRGDIFRVMHSIGYDGERTLRPRRGESGRGPMAVAATAAGTARAGQADNPPSERTRTVHGNQ